VCRCYWTAYSLVYCCCIRTLVPLLRDIRMNYIKIMTAFVQSTGRRTMFSVFTQMSLSSMIMFVCLSLVTLWMPCNHTSSYIVSTEHRWCWLGESIIFKIAVQTWALHGDAPQYLRKFTPIADIPSRQRLRSSSSDNLLVPAVRLSAIGRCAFLVAGARTWNDPSVNVTAAPSLLTFGKRLYL